MLHYTVTFENVTLCCNVVLLQHNLYIILMFTYVTFGEKLHINGNLTDWHICTYIIFRTNLPLKDHRNLLKTIIVISMYTNNCKLSCINKVVVIFVVVVLEVHCLHYIQTVFFIFYFL